MASVAPIVLLLSYFMPYVFSDGLQRSSVNLVLHKSHYHSGPVYKSFPVNVMLECGELCFPDLSCMSFNLIRTSGGLRCDLLGEILTDGELIADTNADFYGMLVIMMIIFFFFRKMDP